MITTSITFSDQPTRQVIEWPIVRTTDRAQCLGTPGGELWVSKALWQRLPPVVDAAGLAELLEVIESVASMQNDARVAVGRLGPGPTQLNCRVGFAVARGSDPAERRRSAIVPLSLLRDEDGQLTAPRWVLQRCLRNPCEQVRGGVWAGLEALCAQLQAAFDPTHASDRQTVPT